MRPLNPTSFDDPIFPGTPSNVSQELLFGLKAANGKLHMAVTAIHWTKRDVLGKHFIAILACLSCLAVSGLLSYLIVCIVRSLVASASSRARSIANFTKSDMGVYFLGLLMTDLVYSSGFAMELVPLRSYYTVHSFSCSYQGFAYSFGCTGNGLWNLAVAAQTFYVLVLGKVTPDIVKWLVATGIVLFQICMTTIGPIISYRAKSPFPFYGPNPGGCYASIGPPDWTIWFRAAPLVSVICLGLMSAIYLVILVKMLGVYKWRDETAGRRWWSFGQGSRQHTPSDDSYGLGSINGGGGSNDIGKEGRRVAYLMLAYPLVYGLLTLPLTLASIFAGFTAIPPPQPFLAFAASGSSAVGLCDTLLFLYTRKRLLLGRKKLRKQSKIHISSHQISRIEAIGLDPLPRRTFNTPTAELHLKPSDGLEDDMVSNQSKAQLIELEKCEVNDPDLDGTPRLQWCQ